MDLFGRSLFSKRSKKVNCVNFCLGQKPHFISLHADKARAVINRTSCATLKPGVK